MWKDKGLQLVMLPTENKVNALRGYADRSLLFRYQENYQILESEGNLTCYYYLYLISDEEIREGDKYYDSHNNLILTASESSDHNTYGYKKVIACLNPSLNLPQFPSSFLEEYVKRYSSKQPMEVELEYEEYDHDEEWSEIGGAYETSKKRVKLNPDNTISIRFKEKKKPYTHEVVSGAMRINSKDVRPSRTTRCSNPSVLPHCTNRVLDKCKCEGECHLKEEEEKMYNRSEVERIVLNFQNDLMNSNHNKHTDIDPVGVKDWIKGNLR